MTASATPINDTIVCPECNGMPDVEECIGQDRWLPAEKCGTCGDEGRVFEFDCAECGEHVVNAEDVGCRECADEHGHPLCAECASEPGLHSGRCKTAAATLVECGDCDKLVPYSTTRPVPEFTDRVCGSCIAERQLAANIQPPEPQLDLVAEAKKCMGVS